MGILPHLLGAAANNLNINNNNNNNANNNPMSRNTAGSSNNSGGNAGNPMNSVRDRLFHALFVRVALAYANAVPPPMRTLFEYVTLVKALLSFFVLAYIHAAFIRMPINCLDHVRHQWPHDGILRIEILRDSSSSPEPYTIEQSYLKEQRLQRLNNPSSHAETRLTSNETDRIVASLVAANSAPKTLVSAADEQTNSNAVNPSNSSTTDADTMVIETQVVNLDKLEKGHTKNLDAGEGVDVDDALPLVGSHGVKNSGKSEFVYYEAVPNGSQKTLPTDGNGYPQPLQESVSEFEMLARAGEYPLRETQEDR